MSADKQNAKRPNRAHGAIDRLPAEVQLQIKDWYLGRPDEAIPRLTYEQISKALAADGYPISKNQIWRWIGRQRRELDRLENARIRAEAVVQAAPAGTTVEDGTRKLVESLIMEAFLDAEPMQAQSITDLGKLTLAYARLSRSAVVREQWEHKKGKQIEEAVAELKAELQKALDGQPELTAKLLDLVEEAQDRMLERIA